MPIKRKGQMSLMMLLVVVMALIFYAVALNWSKISAYKTQVTIASNTGTSALVSMMGSYANYQIQTTLGGQKKYCNNTGVFKALLTFFVLVLAIAVQFIPGVGQVAGSIMTSLIVSAGLAAVSVLVQAVMQPSITTAISKYLQSLPTEEDQFFEQGIQTALSSAMNDTVYVDDEWDLDMDGRWYRFGAGTPGSQIPRFMYYYTQRLREPYKPLEMSNFLLFQEALKGVTIDLGVYSLTGSANDAYYDAAGKLKAECNSCCQSPEVRPKNCSTSIVPAECAANCVQTAGMGACTLAQKCIKTSPTGDCLQYATCSATDLNICYIYDPAFGAWPISQQTTSPPTPPNADRLMNLVGRDDQQWNSPNSAAPAPPKFLGRESQGALFSLLWLMRDTQTDYNGAHPRIYDLSSGDAAVPDSPPCHWCTGQVAPQCDMTDLFHFTPLNTTAYGQLGLSGACSGDTCCVNIFGNNPIDPAQQDSRRIDIVPQISGLAQMKDDACAAPNPVTQLFDRIWKPGNDTISPIFTGTVDQKNYPYKMGSFPPTPPTSAVASCLDANVTSATGQTCSCQSVSTANKQIWRDDFLDEISTHLTLFVQAASAIVYADSSGAQAELAKSVSTWGPGLMNYMKFFTDDNYSIQVANSGGGFTTWNINVFKSLVQRLISNRGSVADPTPDHTKDGLIQPWLEGGTTDSPGVFHSNLVDGNAWCLPGSVGWFEQNNILYYVDAAGNRISDRIDPATGQPVLWGSLESVLQCMDYNSNNASRFNSCAAQQTNAACYNLPRTLIPNFDPEDHTIPGWPTPSAPCAAGMNFLDAPPPDPPPPTDWTCLYNYRADYIQHIVGSAGLAVNQGEKFVKRAAYLRDIRDRLLVYKTKLTAAYALMMQTTHLLQAGVGCPVSNPADPQCPAGSAAPYINLAEAYLQRLMDQASGKSSLKLGNAVYGWLSKTPTSWDATKGRAYGYLHLVKVEASMPTRECAAGISANATKLPWVRTWTEGFLNSKRCYELNGTEGSVGTRVLRYDEDHDPAQGGALKLLNGMPLWQVSYGNPRSSATCNTADVISKCFETHYKRVPNASGSIWIYQELGVSGDLNGGLKGAFILNPPINATDLNSGGAKACLDSIEPCFEKGVGAETCADYFYDGAKMDIHFKKCDHSAAATGNCQ